MGGGGHRHPRYRSCVLARTGGRQRVLPALGRPNVHCLVELDAPIVEWQVWTVRDGKVVRVTLHVDREKALEAAGLRR